MIVANSLDYSEMYKLKNILEEARIPFDFFEEENDEKLHIYYPNTLDWKCSVIFGPTSFGCELGLLEIKGLLTPEEEEEDRFLDDVLGNLTAEEVYQRIYKYFSQKLL